jgi:hypothetical protein
LSFAGKNSNKKGEISGKSGHSIQEATLCEQDVSLLRLKEGGWELNQQEARTGVVPTLWRAQLEQIGSLGNFQGCVFGFVAVQSLNDAVDRATTESYIKSYFVA